MWLWAGSLRPLYDADAGLALEGSWSSTLGLTAAYQFDHVTDTPGNAFNGHAIRLGAAWRAGWSAVVVGDYIAQLRVGDLGDLSYRHLVSLSLERPWFAGIVYGVGLRVLVDVAPGDALALDLIAGPRLRMGF